MTKYRMNLNFWIPFLLLIEISTAVLSVDLPSRIYQFGTHYSTADGLVFDYRKKCSFNILSVLNEFGSWRVVSMVAKENDVVFIAGVSVISTLPNDTTTEYKITTPGKFSVNEVERKIGYEDKEIILMKEPSPFYVLHFKSAGFRVFYDGKNWVKIQAFDGLLSTSGSGLLAKNADGDASNDMTIGNKTYTVEEWFNYWRVDDTERCEKDDEITPNESTHYDHYLKVCELMLSKAADVLNPDECPQGDFFVKSCAKDIFHSQGNLLFGSDILKLVQDQCNNGMTWRKDLFLPYKILSTYGEYTTCIRDVDTCHGWTMYPSSISQPCMEGFRCTEGSLYNGTQCVEKSLCPCTINSLNNGQFIKHRSEWRSRGCTEMCMCSAGNIACQYVQPCSNGSTCYEIDQHRFQCSRTDPCFIANGACSHNCANIDNKATCSCPNGSALYLGIDGKTCFEYIDLCASDGVCPSGNLCRQHGHDAIECYCPDGMDRNEMEECIPPLEGKGCEAGPCEQCDSCMTEEWLKSIEEYKRVMNEWKKRHNII